MKNILSILVLSVLLTGYATAQTPEGHAKLTMGKGFTMIKLDDEPKTIKEGRSTKIPAGHHQITYQRLGNPNFPRLIRDEEIEFDFISGKSYILDGPRGENYVTDNGEPIRNKQILELMREGPASITEK